MQHDHRTCEDEDDARRMAENILRAMGWFNVTAGSNNRDVNSKLSSEELRTVAKNAERIARWTRAELRTRRIANPG